MPKHAAGEFCGEHLTQCALHMGMTPVKSMSNTPGPDADLPERSGQACLQSSYRAMERVYGYVSMPVSERECNRIVCKLRNNRPGTTPGHTSRHENVTGQQAAHHRLRVLVIYEHDCPAVGSSVVYTRRRAPLPLEQTLTLTAKCTGKACASHPIARVPRVSQGHQVVAQG